MGKLFNLRKEIENIIKQKQLEEFKTKGQINLHAGVLISLIKPETPDDNAKFMLIKTAAEKILKVSINVK